MLFDTHTHLCAEKYDSDRQQIIADLSKNNVGRIIEIGAAMDESEMAVSLASVHKNVYASVGVHPYYSKEFTEKDIEILKNLAIHNTKVVAIGECGLDYHDNHYEYKDAQIKAFELQIQLALELSLPLIVHVRDAYEDCLEILQRYYLPPVGADDLGRPRDVEDAVPYAHPGIIHCFSGTREFMETVCDMGFYVAFGGAMTYSNAQNIKEAAVHAPLDRILIETDCPYLVPAGISASRNEPKYVSRVAQLLAELRVMSVLDIEDITWYNACRLFNI
jgi:TatD DNase family protein